MGRILLILVASGLLLSCNNTDTTKSSGDTIRQQSNATAKQPRQLLIAELRNLGVLFSSKDKEKIAALFPFPLADTLLSIFPDDQSFLEQLKKNGNRTTKDMFVNYFPEVYRELQLDQLNELFKSISIDSLNQKDSLVYEIKSSQDPCYGFYHLYLDKDIITLEFGSNTNEIYVDHSTKTGEDENPDDQCEYTSIWYFRFDGTKLHFVKQMAAG